MLWVYIIAGIGLVGIIAETWMSHRKATAQISEDLRRIRGAIHQHEAANSGIEERRQSSVAHTTELKAELEKYTAEVELKRQELEELVELWTRNHPGGDPFDDFRGI